MSATFPLEILTPERAFLKESVEALTVTTIDGQYTFLAGHAPFTAPLEIGSIHIKKDGQWREAFQSEGFVQVTPAGAHVFAQACEWPEEIDENRASEAEHRAQERLRQQRSKMEYQWTKVALTRAMVRLRITGNHLKMD